MVLPPPPFAPRSLPLAAALLVAGWAHAAAPAVTPAPTVLAVMRVQAGPGMPAAKVNTLTQEVVQVAQQTLPGLEVITPQQVDRILNRAQQQQLLNSASDSNALVDVDLAGALHASHLLVASAGRLGDSFVVWLKLIDLRTAKDVAVENRAARSDAELTAAVRDASLALLRHLQTPAPTARNTPAPPPSQPGAVPMLLKAGGAGALVAGALTLAAGAVVLVLAGGLVMVLQAPRVGLPQLVKGHDAWLGLMTGSLLAGAGAPLVAVLGAVFGAAGAAVLGTGMWMGGRE